MTPRGDDDLPALDGEYLYRIRGQVVILDADIGRVFGKSTKAVNQNRARSAGRFPPDYAFQLTAEEWAELKSQFVTSTSHGGRRSAPWAYSEQGFVMLAMGFRGGRADRVARVVAETFVAYRRGELAKEPVLVGADGNERGNSLRARLYDLIEGIASMPLPGGVSAGDELERTTQKALGRVRAWLDQPGLENAKLDAEIANLAAQTQKAYAEVARMDAEIANIWADTILKRLEAVRQLREMASQLERDGLADALTQGFDPNLAVTLGDRKSQAKT